MEAENKIFFESKIRDCVSGIGTQADVNHRLTIQDTPRLTTQDIDTLYTTFAFAIKAVEMPVGDMFRNWRLYGGDGAQQRKIDKETQIKKTLNQACNLARAYGASFVYPDIDAKVLARPRAKVLSPGVRFKTFVIKDEGLGANCAAIEDDFYVMYPTDSGKPIKIHLSWVVQFVGREVNGHAISILQHLQSHLLMFELIVNALGNAASKKFIDILSLESLAKLVDASKTDKDGLAKLESQLAFTLQTISAHQMGFTRGDDTVQRITLDLNDLVAAVTEALKHIASACSIPITRFRGEQQASLSNTGASDLSIYHNMCESERERYQYAIDDIDLMIEEAYGLTEREYIWNPIAERSEADVLAEKKVQAEIDAIYDGILPGYSKILINRLTKDETISTEEARSLVKTTTVYSTEDMPDG